MFVVVRFFFIFSLDARILRTALRCSDCRWCVQCANGNLKLFFLRRESRTRRASGRTSFDPTQRYFFPSRPRVHGFLFFYFLFVTTTCSSTNISLSVVKRYRALWRKTYFALEFRRLRIRNLSWYVVTW